jgi:ribosomal protein L37AE/L43A
MTRPGRPALAADDPEAGALGRWVGGMMAPRFKGKPNFDLSQPCPLCGYKIQPNELMRLASHIIQCPKCGRVFDEMGGRKPISTS